MDIKLFSLCNQEAPDAEEGKKAILDCVKCFFPECGGFSHFTSQKRMLVAISQSLLAADIVLVAVQSTMYNATKRLLCSALDMKTTENDEVSSALNNRPDSDKIKPNIYKANITYPDTALVLPTADYLNCGFALTSGGQHIIYMPVEADKAEEVVFGSLYDYFAELSEPYIVTNAMKNRHVSLIKRAVRKLNNNSVKAAVAGNDASDYLTSYLSKKDSSAFAVDISYELLEGGDIKEIAISAARAVRESSRAELGVYISAPINNDGKLSVYIAIANADGTKTYRIDSESEESAKELSKAATDKLLMLLCDYERIGNTEEESAAEKKADSSLRGILGIVASAAVLAASIAGFITALIMR